MAPISETGHAMNVANFDDLISFVKGYGETYNPSREALKLQSLITLSKSGKDAINALNASLPAYTKAVAAREAAFEPLSKLVTKVMNSLKAIDTSDHIDENALTFARKIQGKRATAKRTEEEIQADKQEEIKNKKEKEEILKNLKNYDKLAKIEDNNCIISGNYFIDKESGIKIEFTDNIVKLFKEEDILSRYNIEIDNFIRLNFYEFLYKLEQQYEISLYKESLEERLTKFNKKLLNFKVYSYDLETKEEKFLKEITIKNIHKEEKIRFEVNDIKMPKQKMSKLFQFLRGNHQPEVIKERIINFEKYAEQIKIYSGIQLKLLEGKTIDISIDDIRVPIHFNIIAEDKENWKISLENFTVSKTYNDIRKSFYHTSGGSLEAISRICESLNADSKLEEIIINIIKGYKEKRRLAEERAEKLFIEFLDKNKGKVFKKDNGYIVKGKLKNYLVKMKDKENAGVWSYPNNEYICINEKTRAGQYLCKYDKLLQFCIAMLNDGNLKQEIYTLH